MVTVAVLLTILPLLIAVPRVLSKGSFALHGDDALIELRVRDIGSHTPLVGSYQRFGFNQPGPLLFYLLVLPYRLLGSRFAALQVAALLTNAAAIVGIALVAFRRGGTVLTLWTLALVAVLAHSLGAVNLSDPWEPHLTVLLLLLLVFLVADVASGRTWSLPLVAALASFLGQAYLVLAPIAAGLFGWAVLSVARQAWRRRGESSQATSSRRIEYRKVVVVTAAVLGVLWLPPLLEQLLDQPGNIGLLVRFLRSPHDALGLTSAFRTVALQFDQSATWLGNRVHYVPFTPTVDIGRSFRIPFALLALIVATVFSIRRRGNATAFALTVLFSVGVGIAGLSRLVGDVFPWILEWTQVLGLACWLAAGWCIYRALRPEWRARLARVLVPALAACVLVLGAVNVVDAVTRSNPRDPGRDAILHLSEAGLKTVRGVHGPVLVTSTAQVATLFGTGRFGDELFALALERGGISVVVKSDLGTRFGKHRAHPEQAVRELRLVTGSPSRQTRGFRVVATVNLTSPAQHREKQRLDAAIRARAGKGSLRQLVDATRADPKLRALVARSSAIHDAPPITLLARDR